MEFTEVAPSPVAPQLPDNHPVEWFGDAKRLFKDCLPPFVHKGTFGLRKRVVLAQWQDKNRSSSEVVHRRWDRWHLVTTIDLNGQRYIVRGFGSAGGGLRYHCWDGSIQDFGTYAVAYSWPRDVADRLEYLRETYEPGSGPGVEHIWRSQAQNPRPIQPIVQNNMNQNKLENDGRLQRTVSTPREFTSPSDDVSAKNIHGQAGLRQSHNLSRSPKSSTVIKPQSTETHTHVDGSGGTDPTTFSDPWNSSTSLKRPATTSMPQGGPSYVFMPTNGPPATELCDQPTNTQQSGKRLHEEPRAAESPPSFDATYKRRRHDREHSGDHDNFGNAIDLNTSPNYPSPRPSLGSGPSQGDLEKLASTPARQTPLEDTIDAPLSSYKQRHTTLRIVLPLSSDFVPLRLSSFMTTASLFESAIAISGSKHQDLKISGLRVTFDWKGEQDVDRAMLLKQEYPDSFEIFLETVAHAPCWRSDGGRCSVGVEVVLE